MMKERLNVFVFINTLKLGGAEKQAIILSKVLKEYFDTKLIVYYGESYDEKYIELVEKYEITTICLDGNHLQRIKEIYKLFKSNRNSITFSYLATTNVIAAFIGGLAGVRYRIGGIRSSRLNQFKFYVQRFLHNHLLTGSIFNNYSGKRYFIERGFNRKKSYVIPNCIPTSHRPIVQNKSGEVMHLLSVGRFVEEKDYETAIKAISFLKEKLKHGKIKTEIKYTIIGFGPLEKIIRKWCEKYNLTDTIEIVINPPNVMDYYQRSDIYLSTSLFEGLSNSIMEAMTHSLPVIATDVGDNSKLVTDNENGCLVPVREPEIIGNKLYPLVIDRDKREQMGKMGYLHVMNNYTEEKFKKNYMHYINMLVDDKK